MEDIWKFINDLLETKIVHSIIVVCVSVILYKIISYFLTRGEEKTNFKLFTSNKGKTYIKLLKSIIRSIFIIITVLIVLQIHGINVSSVLAGVGIFGVIFGLAIQDWLKDIIRGSSIISDSYFGVGDVIKFNGIEGKVMVIGLKTTRIKELATGNIVSIANRNIEQVEVVSNLVYIRVPMPYEVEVKDAEKAIESILKDIRKNDNVTDCRYRGVTELADSSIQYLIEVSCDPQNKLQVRRDALRSILLGLADHNISVPYNQLDVHQK